MVAVVGLPRSVRRQDLSFFRLGVIRNAVGNSVFLVLEILKSAVVVAFCCFLTLALQSCRQKCWYLQNSSLSCSCF